MTLTMKAYAKQMLGYETTMEEVEQSIDSMILGLQSTKMFIDLKKIDNETIDSRLVLKAMQHLCTLCNALIKNIEI